MRNLKHTNINIFKIIKTYGYPINPGEQVITDKIALMNKGNETIYVAISSSSILKKKIKQNIKEDIKKCL